MNDEIDGEWGPNTRRALREFFDRHHVQNSPLLDATQQTIIAIFQSFYNSRHPSPQLDVNGLSPENSNTRMAVSIFQQNNPPLRIDGTIGKDTRSKVVEVLHGEEAGANLDSFDFTVQGIVPVIQQHSENDCWATVATMMLSWRDGTSYTIEQAMDIAGSKYRAKFAGNKRLFTAEKAQLLHDIGLAGEPPGNYSTDALKDLLQSHGPLWVTTTENPTANFSVHASMVIGMFGDGTVDKTFLRIIDPAVGVQINESFRVFARKFEEEVVDSESTDPLLIQIVHF